MFCRGLPSLNGALEPSCLPPLHPLQLFWFVEIVESYALYAEQQYSNNAMLLKPRKITNALSPLTFDDNQANVHGLAQPRDNSDIIYMPDAGSNGLTDFPIVRNAPMHPGKSLYSRLIYSHGYFRFNQVFSRFVFPHSHKIDHALSTTHLTFKLTLRSNANQVAER